MAGKSQRGMGVKQQPKQSPQRRVEPIDKTVRSRRPDIVVWVVSTLVAAVFLGSGAAKLVGQTDAVDRFTHFGYPDALRLLVGALEILGAIGLLVPQASFYAATALGCVMIGAIYSYMSVEEWSQAILPLIVLVALAWIGFARRGK